MIGSASIKNSNASITGAIKTASVNGQVKGKAVIGDAKVGGVVITRTNSIFKIMADTTENWNADPTFIPKFGVLIVYTDKYSYEQDGKIHYSPGIKIADGNSYLIDLPFATDYIDEYGLVYSSGTQEEWARKTHYIPKKNEIIVVTDKNTYNKDGVIHLIPGIKIGDGNAYAVDLPYITDGLERKLDSHIADRNVHVTAIDRAFWNEKLNFTISDDNLILNRL